MDTPMYMTMGVSSVYVNYICCAVNHLTLHSHKLTVAILSQGSWVTACKSPVKSIFTVTLVAHIHLQAYSHRTHSHFQMFCLPTRATAFALSQHKNGSGLTGGHVKTMFIPQHYVLSFPSPYPKGLRSQL